MSINILITSSVWAHTLKSGDTILIKDAYGPNLAEVNLVKDGQVSFRVDSRIRIAEHNNVRKFNSAGPVNRWAKLPEKSGIEQICVMWKEHFAVQGLPISWIAEKMDGRCSKIESIQDMKDQITRLIGNVLKTSPPEKYREQIEFLKKTQVRVEQVADRISKFEEPKEAAAASIKHLEDYDSEVKKILTREKSRWEKHREWVKAKLQVFDSANDCGQACPENTEKRLYRPAAIYKRTDSSSSSMSAGSSDSSTSIGSVGN